MPQSSSTMLPGQEGNSANQHYMKSQYILQQQQQLMMEHNIQNGNNNRSMSPNQIPPQAGANQSQNQLMQYQQLQQQQKQYQNMMNPQNLSPVPNMSTIPVNMSSVPSQTNLNQLNSSPIHNTQNSLQYQQFPQQQQQPIPQFQFNPAQFIASMPPEYQQKFALMTPQQQSTFIHQQKYQYQQHYQQMLTAHQNRLQQKQQNMGGNRDQMQMINQYNPNQYQQYMQQQYMQQMQQQQQQNQMMMGPQGQQIPQNGINPQSLQGSYNQQMSSQNLQFPYDQSLQQNHLSSQQIIPQQQQPIQNQQVQPQQQLDSNFDVNQVDKKAKKPSAKQLMEQQNPNSSQLQLSDSLQSADLQEKKKPQTAVKIEQSIKKATATKAPNPNKRSKRKQSEEVKRDSETAAEEVIKPQKKRNQKKRNKKNNLAGECVMEHDKLEETKEVKDISHIQFEAPQSFQNIVIDNSNQAVAQEERDPKKLAQEKKAANQKKKNFQNRFEKCLNDLKALKQQQFSQEPLQPRFAYYYTDEICTIKSSKQEYEKGPENYDLYVKNLRNYELQEQIKEWANEDQIFVNKIKIDKNLMRKQENFRDILVKRQQRLLGNEQLEQKILGLSKVQQNSQKDIADQQIQPQNKPAEKSNQIQKKRQKMTTASELSIQSKIQIPQETQEKPDKKPHVKHTSKTSGKSLPIHENLKKQEDKITSMINNDIFSRNLEGEALPIQMVGQNFNDNVVQKDVQSSNQEQQFQNIQIKNTKMPSQKTTQVLSFNPNDNRLIVKTEEKLSDVPVSMLVQQELSQAMPSTNQMQYENSQQNISSSFPFNTSYNMPCQMSSGQNSQERPSQQQQRSDQQKLLKTPFSASQIGSVGGLESGTIQPTIPKGFSSQSSQIYCIDNTIEKGEILAVDQHSHNFSSDRAISDKHSFTQPTANIIPPQKMISGQNKLGKSHSSNNPQFQTQQSQQMQQQQSMQQQQAEDTSRSNLNPTHTYNSHNFTDDEATQKAYNVYIQQQNMIFGSNQNQMNRESSRENSAETQKIAQNYVNMNLTGRTGAKIQSNDYDDDNSISMGAEESISTLQNKNQSSLEQVPIPSQKDEPQQQQSYKQHSIIQQTKSKLAERQLPSPQISQYNPQNSQQQHEHQQAQQQQHRLAQQLFCQQQTPSNQQLLQYPQQYSGDVKGQEQLQTQHPPAIVQQQNHESQVQNATQQQQHNSQHMQQQTQNQQASGQGNNGQFLMPFPVLSQYPQSQIGSGGSLTNLQQPSSNSQQQQNSQQQMQPNMQGFSGYYTKYQIQQQQQAYLQQQQNLEMQQQSQYQQQQFKNSNKQDVRQNDSNELNCGPSHQQNAQQNQNFNSQIDAQNKARSKNDEMLMGSPQSLSLENLNSNSVSNDSSSSNLINQFGSNSPQVGQLNLSKNQSNSLVSSLNQGIDSKNGDSMKNDPYQNYSSQQQMHQPYQRNMQTDNSDKNSKIIQINQQPSHGSQYTQQQKFANQKQYGIGSMLCKGLIHTQFIIYIAKDQLKAIRIQKVKLKNLRNNTKSNK
eukprot:403358986